MRASTHFASRAHRERGISAVSCSGDGPMTITPQRRWSFSLRTLFVVVTLLGLVAGWVVYQLNWIRQRRQAVETGEVGLVLLPSAFSAPLYPKPQLPPWTLRLFGEQTLNAQGLVSAPGISDSDLRRLRALFPELQVDRP